jgi:hypothetical protein
MPVVECTMVKAEKLKILRLSKRIIALIVFELKNNRNQ